VLIFVMVAATLVAAVLLLALPQTLFPAVVSDMVGSNCKVAAVEAAVVKQWSFRLEPWSL
jgi:hypothetical protein